MEMYGKRWKALSTLRPKDLLSFATSAQKSAARCKMTGFSRKLDRRCSCFSQTLYIATNLLTAGLYLAVAFAGVAWPAGLALHDIMDGNSSHSMGSGTVTTRESYAFQE